MACLREHGNEAESCRSIAKRYLECRMERCAAHGSCHSLPCDSEGTSYGFGSTMFLYTPPCGIDGYCYHA